MGSAKAAKEALARYFAVALAQKGITVNIISPGACDDSVLSGLPPQVFQMIKDWRERLDAHEAPRPASRRRQRRGSPLH
jgi:NAD(P)-dependent dehydrogenase (short-subunit alcohol dehydrogenase family)